METNGLNSFLFPLPYHRMYKWSASILKKHLVVWIYIDYLKKTQRDIRLLVVTCFQGVDVSFAVLSQ